MRGETCMVVYIGKEFFSGRGNERHIFVMPSCCIHSFIQSQSIILHLRNSVFLLVAAPLRLLSSYSLQFLSFYQPACEQNLCLFDPSASYVAVVKIFARSRRARYRA